MMSRARASAPALVAARRLYALSALESPVAGRGRLVVLLLLLTIGKALSLLKGEALLRLLAAGAGALEQRLELLLALGRDLSLGSKYELLLCLNLLGRLGGERER